MSIGATSALPTTGTVSLLKAANRMPELAGELIQKSLEGMATAPAAPPQATATAPSASAGAPGQYIDIFA